MDDEVTVETYVDNAKVNNVNSGNSVQTGNTAENTTAPFSRLPNAGIRDVVILILIV